MSEYEAVLRIEGDTEPPINVEVDLTDDHLSLRAGEMELASWERSAIRVSALFKMPIYSNSSLIPTSRSI